MRGIDQLGQCLSKTENFLLTGSPSSTTMGGNLKDSEGGVSTSTEGTSSAAPKVRSSFLAFASISCSLLSRSL